MAAEPAIRVAGVTKRYVDDPDVQPALRNVGFEVERGEFVSIIGQSGSGKTTLLNLIGGLDRAYEGKVEVLGRDLASLSDGSLSELRNRSIGFVFQAYHLLPQRSVAENVALPALFGRTRVEGLDGRVASVLERVGLGPKAGERPTALSGGQKQRVAIARALLMEPALLLCDEPTGNLDRDTAAGLIDTLKELNASSSITVVVVTHEERLCAIASRVIRLVDGRIVDGERGGDG